MDDDNDSDKENKDPALVKITPTSKKKATRKKQRSNQGFVVAQLNEPISLEEGCLVFGKLMGVQWMPGKIMQISNPYNIICFWFCDNDVSQISKSHLSSFLNYGSKVDFEALEVDEGYRNGIVTALSNFAEVYRPDLLDHEDVNTMLLDWARLGFVGCALVKRKPNSENNIPCGKQKNIFREKSTELSDHTKSTMSEFAGTLDSEPCSSAASADFSERLDQSKRRKRKISLRTEDSGYNSPSQSVLESSHSPGSDAQKHSITFQSEVDKFVLGNLPYYGWWPGRIADAARSKVCCKAGQRLVYWFGDCTESVLHINNILPITKFPEVFQKSKKGLYRVALYDFLSDAAIACGYTEIDLPECVNIDEGALEKLVVWACNDFKPAGPPDVWQPTPDYHIYRQLKARKLYLSEGRGGEGRRCVACQKTDPTHPHPLFDKELCKSCYEDFTQYAFVFGEDGTGNFCTVCCQGGALFVCEEQLCGRAYCRECIRRVCGEPALQHLEQTDPWFCVLCEEDQEALGELVRRPDWQARLQDILNTTLVGEGEYEVPLPPPLPALTARTSLRVLALFDGIATGLVALNNLGFQIDQYVSSEVDEDCIKVLKVHHPAITHIGDVTKITPQQISEMGPFDLVLGGSPCNDLSNVNPARKGIFEGTGRLFFEFYRVLNYIVQQSGDRHVFWLFENVVSMRHADKCVISRFLQNKPVVIDAKHVSCMKRARYFWGNIPGMRRDVTPLDTDKLTLQECLEQNCERVARFTKIRCITTKSTSVRQGRGERQLPVQVAQHGDMLWCTEIERVFGLEPHYTDVANMSRQARQKLLGKAWSVPVLRHLLSPLQDYFKCAPRD